MARRRRGKIIVYAMGAGIIILLIAEVIYIFAPALLGFSGPVVEVKVFAPVSLGEKQARDMASKLAEIVGAKHYSVELVEGNSSRFIGVIIYEEGAAVAALITPVSLVDDVVSQNVIGDLLSLVPRLRANETVVYVVGMSSPLLVKRDNVVVEGIVRKIVSS
ncbi:hypothetical protein [Hyperthermus butylicus]|uniref:Uncharacterized protein n=1 Tax=Hyperthermus butylicus (strain DSM 5456 / JCM 9403 / PLM1-5) TaxID=415426 RepID=A2BJU8_HYPBU|nr:hypothetical protein [Hyperthermus butylicus]ABM80259.1 hypothetical protein Hbut_0392 [Hyperthermus butylicus DSM 5456]